MKKPKRNNFSRKLLGGLTVGLALGMIGSQVSAGTISNTAHDFSTYTGGNYNGEICSVCHTPHNSNTSVTSAPLWDHALTQTVFTPYDSPTLDATATNLGQPGGISLLCLSCHDGSVAIDSFGGLTGGDIMNGSEVVGLNGDLTDDHPISIIYDATLVGIDAGLNDPSNPVTIGEGAKTRDGTITELMTSAGSVQCSSCHDVHNGFTIAGTPLLKVTTAGSGLCLTCHNK